MSSSIDIEPEKGSLSQNERTLGGGGCLKTNKSEQGAGGPGGGVKTRESLANLFFWMSLNSYKKSCWTYFQQINSMLGYIKEKDWLQFWVSSNSHLWLFCITANLSVVIVVSWKRTLKKGLGPSLEEWLSQKTKLIKTSFEEEMLLYIYKRKF